MTIPPVFSLTSLGRNRPLAPLAPLAPLERSLVTIRNREASPTPMEISNPELLAEAHVAWRNA